MSDPPCAPQVYRGGPGKSALWQSMSGGMNSRPGDSTSSSWKERDSPLTADTCVSVSIAFAISHTFSKIKPDTYFEELLSISFSVALFLCY